MRTARPLPNCPVCGDEPREVNLGSPGFKGDSIVECHVTTGGLPHTVSVYGHTRCSARARWRRAFALGQKEADRG